MPRVMFLNMQTPINSSLLAKLGKVSEWSGVKMVMSRAVCHGVWCPFLADFWKFAFGVI